MGVLKKYRRLCKSPQELQQDFLSSIIPTQIEFGNPDFLSGKSGLELAFFLYQNIEQKIEEALQEPYYPQAEYWAGFVVAYAQWKLQIPFSTLFSKYPLERIMANKHTHVRNERSVGDMNFTIAEGFIIELI